LERSATGEIGGLVNSAIGGDEPQSLHIEPFSAPFIQRNINGGHAIAIFAALQKAADNVTSRQKFAMRINEKGRPADSVYLGSPWEGDVSTGYGCYRSLYRLDRFYECIGLLSVNSGQVTKNCASAKNG
jgi:hypothetical protein